MRLNLRFNLALSKHSPNRRNNIMCGIVGLVSQAPVQRARELAEALNRQKYRGYDSAGNAHMLADGTVATHKFANGENGVATNKSLDALMCASSDVLPIMRGIAHTRWATHGPVSTKNCHPHASSNASIYVVHNGILSNYAEIKARLVAQGSTFTSDTDTEVIAEAIARARQPGMSLREAVEKSLATFDGSYGLVVMSSDLCDPLVAVSFGSPLVLGVETHICEKAVDTAHDVSTVENILWLASDYVALQTMCSSYVTLPQGSVTEVWADGRVDSSHAIPAYTRMPTEDRSEANSHSHVMLQEIWQQPQATRTALLGRIAQETDACAEGAYMYRTQMGALDTPVPGYPTLRDILREPSLRITIAAQGTSYYAGKAAELVLKTLAPDVPVECVYGAEYQRRTHNAKCELAIFPSQSGETLDSLNALRHAKKLGAVTFGMTNRPGSGIARESHVGMHLRAGLETAVASTKAFTAQGVCFMLLALELARVRGSISSEQHTQLVEELQTIPTHIETVLAASHDMDCTLPKTETACMFLGAGTSFALAGEAALKVQEVGYVYAHAFHLSEQKHGPIALITPHLPIFAFVPNDGCEKLVGDALEIAHARGASVYTIGHAIPEQVVGKITAHYQTPCVLPELFPLVAAPWVQLISAQTGLARGNDIDLPRHLAKSVTV